ncbi:MAG: pre-peptidase C-terminal domain-containing protein, partial [Chloroflexi bacterium]|nr:pre-peptidase C-terminal domain-containing protein [Chloroflexota bacterium]
MLALSLLLVLLIGLLLLFSILQLKARVDAEQRASDRQLTAMQASIAQLSSSEGVRLRNALADAQSRLAGVATDYDAISSQRVRWSMVLRAVQSHPQVKVEEIVQTPRSLQLTLKGVTSTDQALMEFGNGLRGSGLFDDVRIQSMGGGNGTLPPGLAGPSLPPSLLPTFPPGATPPQQLLTPSAPVGPPIPPGLPIPSGGAAPSTASGTTPTIVGPVLEPGETDAARTATAMASAARTPTPTATAKSAITSTTPSATATAGYEYTVVWKQSTYVPEKDASNRYPGTISGKLVDAADQLVPGATFRIESYGSPVWTADSPGEGRQASNGEFAFTTLRRATYRVYVVAGSSQAAADLNIGTDGVPGYNNWYIVFKKNTPGAPAGSVTPSPTGTPPTETATASPTATPTFGEPTSDHSTRAAALDLSDKVIWWDCICSSGNEDWFKINVPTTGSRLTMTMGQGGSLGLYIADPSGTTVASDLSGSQTKTLNWDIGTQTGYWYVRVSAVNYGYYSNTPYFLSPLITQPTATPAPGTATPTPSCGYDPYEPNNSFAQAKPVDAYPLSSYICYPNDVDYYSIRAYANSTLNIQVTQPVPLNLYLFNSDQQMVASSMGQATPQPASVTYVVPAATPTSAPFTPSATPSIPPTPEIP